MSAENTDPLHLVGTLLDERFRVEAYANSGASASVYRAVEVETGYPVAIKVLDLGGMDHEIRDEVYRRFLREGSAFSELRSPHTVRLFAVGNTPADQPYLALEWIDGETLNDRFRKRCPLPAEEVIALALQMVDALAEAHGLGVVHRDIKPGNILLTRASGGGDFVKLVDFGLAKDLEVESTLTRADALVGTPTFMSPEQILGASGVDRRSDLYSLGVILFLGLTGKRPFPGKLATQVVSGHLRSPVPSMAAVAPNISIPRELEWVVRTCMAKDREDRFASADELRLALRLCLLIMQGAVKSPERLVLVRGKLDIPGELRSTLEEWKGLGLTQATPIPPVRVDLPSAAAPATAIGLVAIVGVLAVAGALGCVAGWFLL